MNAPAPGDATQLKSFIGLVNYYSKFLPSLADTLAPLYKLLGNTSVGIGERNRLMHFRKQNLSCLLTFYWCTLILEGN